MMTAMFERMRENRKTDKGVGWNGSEIKEGGKMGIKFQYR